ncbi:MAG: hypothetical protein RL693_435 [Verrucomicrobiota bacterium]|jgi:hypothetical protein
MAKDSKGLLSSEAVNELERKRSPNTIMTRFYARFLVTVVIVPLVFAGCSNVPSRTVLLSSRDLTSPALRPVPESWEGRLLRAGVMGARTGGQDTHTHSIAHRHEVIVKETAQKVSLFGIDSKLPSRRHEHKAATHSMDTSATGDGAMKPPSVTVRAAVVRGLMFHVPEGTIIGYSGASIPENWQAVNGSNGDLSLDARYLMISRNGPTGLKQGDWQHGHTLNHHHGWTAAIMDVNNRRNIVLGLRTIPHPNPDIEVDSLDHTHSVREIQSSGVTIGNVAAPQSATLRFIECAQASEFPSGSVVPYTGWFVPLGWKPWRAPDGSKVTGRYIYATATEPSGNFFGSRFHQHAVVDRFAIILQKSTGTPTKGRELAEPVPAALPGHSHSFEGTNEWTTGVEEVEPPFVSVRFIEKK